MFTIDENDSMCIPAGLYPFLKSYFENSNIIDKRINKNKYDTTDILKNIHNYDGVLNGITLRDA